jgi:hypothetical protein
MITSETTRKTGWAGLIGMLAGLMTLIVLVPMTPAGSPRYRSSAVILLAGRETQRAACPTLLSFARDSCVLPAILTSRRLAEAVVDRLSKDSVEELARTAYGVTYWPRLTTAYLRWRGVEPSEPNLRQRAIAELQRARMTFQAWPDKIDIISVSAEASQPLVVLDIVNVYLDQLKVMPTREPAELKVVKVIDPASRPVPVGSLRWPLAILVAFAIAGGVGIGVSPTGRRITQALSLSYSWNGSRA